MHQLRRGLTWLASLIGILWAGATGFLYLNQDGMVFPVPEPGLPPAVYENFKPLTLTTPDGETLNLLQHRMEKERANVILFHGNGGDVTELLPAGAKFAQAGYGVLIAEYRGYNNSSGQPSQQGLYTDALAAFDFLKSETDAPIFLLGNSLGTAMAIHVAANRDAKAVALLAPFDSLAAVAQGRYPYLPVKTLLRHPFPSDEKIGQISEPMIIYHGDEDRVVPLSHGEALYRAAPGNAQFHRINGARHNNLREYGVIESAIEFFHSIDP